MQVRTYNPAPRRPVGAPPFPQWHAPNPAPAFGGVQSGCIGNPATVIPTGPYSANPGALGNPWPGAEFSGYQAAIARPMLGGMPGAEYSGYQRNAYVAYGAGVGRQGFAAPTGYRPNPCGAPMMPNPCGAPMMPNPCGAPMMPNPCGCESPQSNPCGPRVPQYGPDRAPRLNPCDCEGAPTQNPCVQGSPCCPEADARLPNPGVELSCKEGYDLSCVSFGGPNQECRCKKCGGVPYSCDYAPPVVTQIPFKPMGQFAAPVTAPARLAYRNPCWPA